MNAAALLLPFLLVRFGLMALLDRRALRRAAHFAPLRGGERAAYVVYQASNLCIFLGLAFCAVEFDRSLWFCAGLACYALGLCLCAAAVVAFARPDGAGMSARGVYRLSRQSVAKAPKRKNHFRKKRSGSDFCFLRQHRLQTAVTYVQVSSLVCRLASLACGLSQRPGSLLTLSTY